MSNSFLTACPECSGVNRVPADRLVGRHDIRAIPTMIPFEHGEPAAQRAGAMYLQQLVQWLNANL